MGFDPAAVATRMTTGADMFGPGFPRNLAAIAPFTLPVTFITRSGLTTEDVVATVAGAIGRDLRFLKKRRLRGCLVAHAGQGMIFLDEDDPNQMRFASGHELAHFVGHYLIRRELAMARLGTDIVEVLDGHREPAPEERLAGILVGCPLGTFADVMERDGGVPLSASAEVMEFEADEAAFLALAPIGPVIARTIAREGAVQRTAVTVCLVEEFGLAAPDARRHAPRIIAAASRSRPSLVDQLRFAASEGAGERHK